MGNATAPVPAYPGTGVEAGDLVLLVVVNKEDTATPNTPAGFTPVPDGTGTGGTGTAGADTGLVRVSSFYREASGGEDGTSVTLAFTGTVNGAQAVLLGFTRDVAATWAVAGGGTGSDPTGASPLEAVVSVAVDVASGDYVVPLCGITTDSVAVGACTLTVPGCTVGTLTERVDNPNTLGFDTRMGVDTGAVTAGTSSGAATVSIASTSTGVLGLVRLREVVASASRAPDPVVSSAAAVRASTW